MILRADEIAKSEMHLVPITDLREQIRRDRQDSAEKAEQERPVGGAVATDRRKRMPAR